VFVADQVVQGMQETFWPSFPEWDLRLLARGLKARRKQTMDWQKMSMGLPESVILAEQGVTGQVTVLRWATENTDFPSRRPSDFRHLGLWPPECDSTCELVIQPKQSNGDEDIKCVNKRASHLSNF
jgi:hypothetical protein